MPVCCKFANWIGCASPWLLWVLVSQSSPAQPGLVLSCVTMLGRTTRHFPYGAVLMWPIITLRRGASVFEGGLGRAKQM